MCVCVCVYIYMYTYVCIPYIHNYMYVCMYVCMYAFMYVCVYVRMYVCMHVCIQAHTHRVTEYIEYICGMWHDRAVSRAPSLVFAEISSTNDVVQMAQFEMLGGKQEECFVHRCACSPIG